MKPRALTPELNRAIEGLRGARETGDTEAGEAFALQVHGLAEVPHGSRRISRDALAALILKSTTQPE